MHARAAAATTAALLGVAVVWCCPHATAHGRAQEHRADPWSSPTAAPPAYAPENTLAAIDKADDARIRLGRERRPAHQGRPARRHPRRQPGAHDRRRGGLPRPGPVEGQGLHRRGDRASWTRAAGSGPRVRGRARTDPEAVHEPGLTHNHQKLVLEIKNPELYPGIEQETLKRPRQRGLARTGPRQEQAGRPELQRRQRTDRARAAARHHDRLPRHAVESRDLPAYAQFADQINPSHTTDLARLRHRGPRASRDRTASTWRSSPGPWTTRTTARRVAGFGVDGIITNKPDVVRKALSRTERRRHELSPVARTRAGRSGPPALSVAAPYGGSHEQPLGRKPLGKAPPGQPGPGARSCGPSSARTSVRCSWPRRTTAW